MRELIDLGFLKEAARFDRENDLRRYQEPESRIDESEKKQRNFFVLEIALVIELNVQLR